jgi:hypothetical protein
MKVAVYNEFIGEISAETELSKRICLAAENLGWEAIEVGSSIEVKKFNPDFLLALHFRTPKLAGFPTYGCMWNPIDFFELYEKTGTKKEPIKENILTYDGYLSSSLQMDVWLEDLLYGTNKKYFISSFYTSCHQINYQPPNLDNSHLVYIGTNWDGSRFQELFQYLDTKEYMEIYGPQNAWTYLNKSYKGSIPFDGVSVLKTLNKAGIGLCLHKEEHVKSAIPSMRIFEIVSSGALAICEEHPFIQEAFGDSVFYIDSKLSPSEKSNQISRYVWWIRNNQKEALQMSARAYKIFMEKYSLENLLLGIVPHHQKLIKEKGFVSRESIQINDKRVEIIVRVGGRPVDFLKRCLDSIVNQTYNNIRVIIVKYQELENLDNLLAQYQEKISIKLIESEFSGFRSTQLTAGINAVNSEYFGILDDDDLIHPNHIYSLVSLLEKFDDAGVAYSGSIRVWESDRGNDQQVYRTRFIQEKAELAYFEPFDLNKILIFDNFIVSNSFIARSSLIDENIKKDYNLKVAEDMFLLLNLCRKAKFYWRFSKNDNSSFENDQDWVDAAKRLKHMFWKKDFACSSHILFTIDTIDTLDKEKPQSDPLQLELEYTRQIIDAMQTSKFWKLRNFWLKLRKNLGLPTKKQLL